MSAKLARLTTTTASVLTSTSGGVISSTIVSVFSVIAVALAISVSTNTISTTSFASPVMLYGLDSNFTQISNATCGDVACLLSTQVSMLKPGVYAVAVVPTSNAVVPVQLLGASNTYQQVIMGLTGTTSVGSALVAIAHLIQSQQTV